MRRFLIVLVSVIVGIAVPWAYYEYIWRPAQPSAPTSVQVFFSPRGGCATAIIDVIRGAKKEVLIQAYGFTQKDIAMAAVEADRRGVPVRALLDKSNRTAKYSAADFLRNMGVAVWIDDSHAIAHNKVMIIDQETVITGSFNFTQAAEERNAENVLIIKDVMLAKKYRENWEAHLGHAEEYLGRSTPQGASVEAALQEAVGADEIKSASELATSQPTPTFFAVSMRSKDRRKRPVTRWGYSEDLLMEQVLAGDEELIWLGDPEKDARNSRAEANGETADGTSQDVGYRPKDRQRLVIQKEASGLPYAVWWPRLGLGRQSKEDATTLWQGAPYGLLVKQQEENVQQMSAMESEAVQQ